MLLKIFQNYKKKTFQPYQQRHSLFHYKSYIFGLKHITIAIWCDSGTVSFFGNQQLSNWSEALVIISKVMFDTGKLGN